MDNSDIAAAALKKDHRGPCNCQKHSRTGLANRSCKKCQGTGIIHACRECSGSGWNAKQQKPCSICEGNGYRNKPTQISPLEVQP